MSFFAELAVTTNYSFLRGASHPKELVEQAAKLGHGAIGIADRNSLAGVVRAYAALKDLKAPKPRLLVGARLVFRDGAPDVLAYPTDRAAYGRLCRLLSAGKMRAPKGECYLTFEDLLRWQEGLLLIVRPPHPLRYAVEEEQSTKAWNEKHSDWQKVPDVRVARDEDVAAALNILRHAAPDRAWLGVSMPYLGDDLRRLRHWKAVAEDIGVPLIATNDVHYHEPERRMLQDVVTCIRNHVTLDAAGLLLNLNAERHLKSESEMRALFAAAPEAVKETQSFATRITFTLDQLKYNYPDESVPKGKTPQQHLEDLAWAGAVKHYGMAVPEKIRIALEKELVLIGRMEIAQYFLTVNDVVQFARSESILCQGRGSAANSAVCFVLDITPVDPNHFELLFERFISEERKEPPDIDVDFEHERREEVIQFIYKRYGRDRAALAATVISYRSRSAIGEVGKVFGLMEDVTARIASSVWGSWGTELKDGNVRQGKLDPHNSVLEQAIYFANELTGFPRHLSQHVGGFVLTQDRLDETVPVGPATMKDRFFVEWDKDDLDALRMLKVDVLALGMLTCIRKSFDLMRLHEGINFDLKKVPRERPEVYEMMQKADTIGVFQIESRAQMSMLPRLKPKEFYDLVIEVAIVRPGPIQGDMVHPYLRRRSGKEPVEYPSPAEGMGDKDELVGLLGKTFGVPLFQEQAMKLAIIAAEFTPQEANGLRRAMATFRNLGTIDQYKDKFINGMVRRGYEPDFAARCYRQIEGFGSYGFPESHAAAFAHLVYISAYLKKHHPAAFAASLLNSQPMGFYAPAEIVRDAQERGGVKVRHVDVNDSNWDNTLEASVDGLALRLGFRQVDSFREDWAKALVSARGNRYGTVAEVAKKAKLPKRALIILAEADSFQSIDKDRREILWAVRRLPDDDELPLFAAAYAQEQPEEVIAPLPLMPMSEQVVADYQMLRLSLKAHLMFFLRDFFRSEGVSSSGEINAMKDGTRASCAGIVLVRQMPGDSGVVFATISDEESVVNVVVWPRLVEVFRREIMGARLMLVKGKVQRSEDNVVHLVAEQIFDRSEDLHRLSEDDQNVPSWRAQASSMHKHPRNVRSVLKSRDFH
ncbi:error-prone DNA polymerase [Aestuariivirga litoralis]|uniref:error-prone DNA polymerase n=1 Tax=Aestuariivirga litoralis TaxID=2650924 RepID=UPI0018C78E13|nr:error-prone DNA polymerase [Aestuariivirga litoralis]MBG1233595.1 DNA polymerase III subunit alpha [Aestuariivirga litoralis]